jgi:hypothetical protein
MTFLAIHGNDGSANASVDDDEVGADRSDAFVVVPLVLDIHPSKYLTNTLHPLQNSRSS